METNNKMLTIETILTFAALFSIGFPAAEKIPCKNYSKMGAGDFLKNVIYGEYYCRLHLIFLDRYFMGGANEALSEYKLFFFVGTSHWGAT